MAANYNDLPLVNNTKEHRFELVVEGYTAFIEYYQTPSHITLTHTEVPEELEGKGVGSAIVLKTLEYIEQHQWKLVPVCPFVVAFLKRHPEWNRVLHESVDQF